MLFLFFLTVFKSLQITFLIFNTYIECKKHFYCFLYSYLVKKRYCSNVIIANQAIILINYYILLNYFRIELFTKEYSILNIEYILHKQIGSVCNTCILIFTIIY